MKMGKLVRVPFVASSLFLALVGCGKDTRTDPTTSTSTFTVSTSTTTGTNTGSGATNHAPVISSLTASPATISVGGTTTLTCLASDAENDPLTYSWEANGGTFSGFSGSGTTISWTAPAGSYIVSCRTTDGKLETVAQVSVGVQAPVPVPTPAPVNHAPVITSLTASHAPVVTNETISFSCIATDADNDPLTYTWSASSGTITGTGSTISWTAPATVGSTTMNLSQSSTSGTATITCKASDGKAEASTQASVTVLVWIVPTQFLGSIGPYGRMDGVVYLGKLYLVWAKSNSWGTAYKSSYLSIFDTNTASAVELSRSEIFGPNGEPSYPSSMAIDHDGIYLAASVVNGGEFLTALNFDGTVRWTRQDFPPSLGALLFRKIIVQDGFLYVSGDCWWQNPSSANPDVIIGKFDTSGTLIWISQWGTSGYDYGESVEAKTDGLYVSVSAGIVMNSSLPPPSYKGRLTLKYDFDGNLISVIQ